ncbi:hypothetical protein [Streptomyces antimycoticus]|uniref:hypothetical protein n=1 Tax=Streptomyces antimycoticus TaxID=68175 RepID=UPI00386860DD|nr:hypothetical protein OG751_23095 [Streptomyces antimycoticus]
MNPHRMAVESAKRVLEDAKLLDMGDDRAVAQMVGRLEVVVKSLLGLAEAQPKSARLKVQHDEEFKNLARAARMEIHAAMGSLQRLDRFEQALTGMVESENGGQE